MIGAPDGAGQQQTVHDLPDEPDVWTAQPSGQPSQQRDDPWAHRRGEPRLFAVLWVMYVMAAMAGSVRWVYGATAVTQDSYSPAARIMLIVIAVGAFVLWPMVRLSQAPPRQRVLTSVLLDAWVVAVPVLMVVWPMIYMAGWPLEVVLAMSLLVLAWLVLISGILANALLGGRSVVFTEAVPAALPNRWAWMLAVLLLVLAAPTLGLVLKAARARRTLDMQTAVPEWLELLSPFTGVLVVAGRGIAGPQHLVSIVQWGILLGIGAVGALLWCVAWGRSRSAKSVKGWTEGDSTLPPSA